MKHLGLYVVLLFAVVRSDADSMYSGLVLGADATPAEIAAAMDWSTAIPPTIGIIGPAEVQAGSSAQYDFLIESGNDPRFANMLYGIWEVYQDGQLLGSGVQDSPGPIPISLSFDHAGYSQISYYLNGSETLRVSQFVPGWDEDLQSDGVVVTRGGTDLPISLLSIFTVHVTEAAHVAETSSSAGLFLMGLVTLLPVAKRRGWTKGAKSIDG